MTWAHVVAVVVAIGLGALLNPQTLGGELLIPLLVATLGAVEVSRAARPEGRR